MEGIEILRSAYKHGVTREQILAVLRLPYRIARIGDDTVLTIGGDESGRLFEVITIGIETYPRVIHAMPLRAKFTKYL